MGIVVWDLQQYKHFENRLRFDNVTESLKVGTFLRHSVDSMSLVFESLTTLCKLSLQNYNYY